MPLRNAALKAFVFVRAPITNALPAAADNRCNGMNARISGSCMPAPITPIQSASIHLHRSSTSGGMSAALKSQAKSASFSRYAADGIMQSALMYCLECLPVRRTANDYSWRFSMTEQTVAGK